MSTTREKGPPDEDLAEALRERGTAARQAEAYDLLVLRHGKSLRWLAETRVFDRGQMLANLKFGSVEEMVADVLWRAIRGYRRGKGATFRTYLHRIMENLVITSKRLAKKLVTVDPEDGGIEGLGFAATGGLRPGSTAHLVLLEARDLGERCLKALSDRERRIFVWGVLAGFTHEQLGDLCPDLTPANLRKIKSRAATAFMEEWVRLGGEKPESLAHGAVAAMSERIDPDRIRDPRAREAYRAWLVSGLAGAAKALGLGLEETRTLLLSAAHELYDAAPLRGRGTILASVLEIGDGAPSGDPLLTRARHTLDLVRAAFGLAPIEAAFHTLGSFVQSRLRTAADYDALRGALGISPGDLRRLLADDLPTAAEMLKPLARALGVPVARLRTLPRSPLEGPRLATRRTSAIDWPRIRACTLARCARPKRKR